MQVCAAEIATMVVVALRVVVVVVVIGIVGGVGGGGVCSVVVERATGVVFDEVVVVQPQRLGLAVDSLGLWAC